MTTLTLEDMKKLNFSYICWLACKIVQTLWNKIQQFPMKLNIHLTYSPDILLLR